MTRPSSTYTESSVSKRDRDTCESVCALPGETSGFAIMLRVSREAGMEPEESAEAILRSSTMIEGPNLTLRGRDFDCVGAGDVEMRTEKLLAYAKGSRRNRQEVA